MICADLFFLNLKKKKKSEPFERVNQRSRAIVPNLGLGPPKGVSIDRLSGVGASAGVCLLPWGYCGVAAVLAVCCVCCGPYRLLCGGGSTLWG